MTKDQNWKMATQSPYCDMYEKILLCIEMLKCYMAPYIGYANNSLGLLETDIFSNHNVGACIFKENDPRETLI